MALQSSTVGFNLPGLSARNQNGGSGSVFPHHVSKQPHQEFKQGLNIVTNLPLQMAIYFNCFYFPFWFLTFLISFITKIDALEQVYKVIVGACLVTMTVVEIPRLYFGYAGNLKEGVSSLNPWLHHFNLLTTVSITDIPIGWFLVVDAANTVATSCVFAVYYRY